MEQILITGGAGFVGSHLCNAFISLGYDVFTVDDLSNGDESNINDAVHFEKLDLSTEQIFTKFGNIEFKAVIHCAAQSSNALSFLDIKKDLDSNLISTYNVLKFCKKKKINRLIFTSSVSVYGQAKLLPTPETCTPYPESYYAINKLSAEQYIRLFSSDNDINYTIFRLFTTYGEGQNLQNRNQGLLSIFISYILSNEELIVKGSPNRKRDIICVSDVVDAIVRSYDAEITFKKTYNLGSGKSLSVGEIIDLLIKGLAVNPHEYPIRYEDNTAGDPFETRAEMSSLKLDLCWTPELMPKEGIQKTIEFYKQNK
jgi:UDP-glucose 4-epimerase